MTDVQSKTDALVGMASGLALMTAKGEVDMSSHLVAHLARCVQLADQISQMEALQKANDAIRAARATNPDFDAALPFIFVLCTAFVISPAVVGVEDLLDACCSVLHHAKFTEPLRQMLPELRRNHELRMTLKGLQ